MVKQLQSFDSILTVISILASFFLLLESLLMGYLARGIFKKERKWKVMTVRKVFALLLIMLLIIPVLLGLYFMPTLLGFGSWWEALLRMPFSFKPAVLLTLGVFGMGLLIFLISSLFPAENTMLNKLPSTIIISLIAGFANSVLVLMITNASQTSISPLFLCGLFAIVFLVYLLGNKYAKTKLARMTNDLVYQLRTELIEKLLSTHYQSFEKMDKGRIYSTLNDDTTIIGNAATMIVSLIINSIMIICVLIYLSIQSVLFTAILLGVSALIVLIYYLISMGAYRYLENARDSVNLYMQLINGLIGGFKELSMHRRKRNEYESDLEESCSYYRNQSNIGAGKYINAEVFGDSMFLMLLGFIAILAPALFTGLLNRTMILGFTMVFLYLIGPISEILNTIPLIAKMRVSWGRIQDFLNDIPPTNPKAIGIQEKKPLETLVLEDVVFEYEENGREKFQVGPINFKLEKGQILFIIGGNGSGKTTLAKLITGLYQPKSGKIKINGEEVAGIALGESFSTVFSDYHLFQKIYSINVHSKEDMVHEYLKMLELENKVFIDKNAFSTIDLSGGQRKRLALLKCYIEDSPIYLFDEWAADQDPHFRKFFYRDLLKRMKAEEKIIIAITHDDHYFDVADKIIKLDFGKIDQEGQYV